MPKQSHNPLHGYLSKIKIYNKQIRVRFGRDKRLETASFADLCRGRESGAMKLLDGDQFSSLKFSSIYLEYEEESVKRGQAASFLLDSPRIVDPPPLENLCGSARFFVASGSSSALITDGAISSNASVAANDVSALEEGKEIAEEDPATADGFVAVLTYSRSPYEDFRQSMSEMVEAHFERSGDVDWAFMEDLLFCYLDLNHKSSYRFILRAFVDLVAVLRRSSGRSPSPFPPWNGRGHRIKLLK